MLFVKSSIYVFRKRYIGYVTYEILIYGGNIMVKVNVIMPKFGMTMKKGAIVEWKKKAGARVEKGEIIAVVESEKITGEVEAPASGTLVEVLHDVGDEVPVGEPIAIIETEE